MSVVEYPTRIYLDEDAKNYLKNLKNEKIIIVTDGFMANTGSFQGLMNWITSENECQIYSDVVTDPPIENIIAGVKHFEAFNPTVIIGFGGGSPMDAAKAMKYFAEKSGAIKENRFIAIPTTSGTGSEVTNFAVITDDEKGQKYPLVTADIQPDDALLITDFVLSVPGKVTAETGMDVLTHVIESYVSTETSLFNESLCEKVVQVVFDELFNCYKNGSNLEARRKMHYASCMAGMAFNTTSLGVVHGLAHSLGGRYHLIHGRLNAVILPMVIEFNAGVGDFSSRFQEETAKRYAHLASLLDGEKYSPKAGALALVRAIRRLNQKLGLPENLSHEGVDSSQVRKDLPEIVSAVLADKCTLTNPVQPSTQDIEQIIRKLFLV